MTLLVMSTLLSTLIASSLLQETGEPSFDTTPHTLSTKQNVVDSIWTRLRSKKFGRVVPDDKVLESLIDQGEDTLVELLAVHWGEAPHSDVTTQKRDPGPEDALSERDKRLLGRAIALVGDRAYLKLLDNLNQEIEALERRLQLIEFLGQYGDEHAVPLYVEIINTMDHRRTLKPQVIQTVTRSLSRQSQGSEKFLKALDPYLKDMPEGSVRLLVNALGQAATENTLTALGRWLGESQERDGWIFQQVKSDFAASLLGRTATARLHKCMGSRKNEVQLSAIQASAYFRDSDSVSRLIDLLADPDRRISKSAHRSLTKLSGKRFPEQVAVWKEWHYGERAWFSKEGARLERDIQSGEKPDTLRALMEIPGHGLFRDDFARAIAYCIQTHPEPDVRLKACEVARRLECPELIGALVDALDDSNPGVQKEAHRALGQMTRLEIDSEATTWKEALARSIK